MTRRRSVVELSERCDDGNTVNGDDCSSPCDGEESLLVAGQGQSGSVTIVVEG